MSSWIIDWILLQVQYQKFTIIASSRKIEKLDLYAVLSWNLHGFFWKHKSTSKPKKSSLIHTSQGKIMIEQIVAMVYNWFATIFFFFGNFLIINITLMRAKALTSIFSNWWKLPIPWLCAECLNKDLSYYEILRTNSGCIFLGGKPIKDTVSWIV